MPKELKPKPIIHQGWGTSKSGVALRIFYRAPRVGENGMALKDGEKVESLLTSLHVHVIHDGEGSLKERSNHFRITMTNLNPKTKLAAAPGPEARIWTCSAMGPARVVRGHLVLYR